MPIWNADYPHIIAMPARLGQSDAAEKGKEPFMSPDNSLRDQHDQLRRRLEEMGALLGREQGVGWDDCSDCDMPRFRSVLTSFLRELRLHEAAETRAHVEWLERAPQFDVTLCLHEDWESHGFYLYELNPDNRPSHAEEMIRRVAEVCPIDLSTEIEERAAQGGIVRPNIDPLSRPQWPEAFWLLRNRTRHSYTLEAPSDFPLATRVDALVTAVRTVLEA